MKTLTDMYYELELEEQAAAIERERIALLRQLYGSDDHRVAEALIAFAASLHSTAHRDEILPALIEAKRILDANGDTTSRLRGELLTRLAQRHQNISLEKMRAYADEAVRVLQPHAVADEDRMSTALHLAARARVQLGDYAEGERLYRASIQELRKSSPVPQVALLQGAVALAEAIVAQQHFDSAIQELREAGDTVRKTLGPDDPGTIVADSRLAALLHAVGRRDEARRLHEDALRRVLAVKGENDTLFTPIVRSDYGRSLFTEGRLKEADDQIRRVVEIDRRHYPDSAVLGHVLRTLASIETARGRYAEARALFAEASVAWLRGTGAGLHPSRNNRFLLDEARLDLATGDPATAIDRLKRVTAPPNAAALQLRNEETERDILLSAASLQAGNAQDALTLARNAHTAVLTSSAREAFPALEADASIQLARALLANRRPEESRTYAERALTLRRGLGDPMSPWIAEAHLVLAEALRIEGITVRANENAARARAIFAARGEVGDQFRGGVVGGASRASRVPD
jgi:tetratricopeptide (TPR) repeat protein